MENAFIRQNFRHSHSLVSCYLLFTYQNSDKRELVIDVEEESLLKRNSVRKNGYRLCLERGIIRVYSIRYSPSFIILVFINICGRRLVRSHAAFKALSFFRCLLFYRTNLPISLLPGLFLLLPTTTAL